MFRICIRLLFLRKYRQSIPNTILKLHRIFYEYLFFFNRVHCLIYTNKSEFPAQLHFKQFRHDHDVIKKKKKKISIKNIDSRTVLNF